MRNLGKIVMTRGTASYMKDIAFKMAVDSALTKFAQKDWGEVCADDAALNNQAYSPFTY